MERLFKEDTYFVVGVVGVITLLLMVTLMLIRVEEPREAPEVNYCYVEATPTHQFCTYEEVK